MASSPNTRFQVQSQEGLSGGLNLQFLKGTFLFLKNTLSFLQILQPPISPEPSQKSKHMKSLEKGARFPLVWVCVWDRVTRKTDRHTGTGAGGFRGGRGSGCAAEMVPSECVCVCVCVCVCERERERGGRGTCSSVHSLTHCPSLPPPAWTLFPLINQDFNGVSCEEE